jgi:hypothetical protein
MAEYRHRMGIPRNPIGQSPLNPVATAETPSDRLTTVCARHKMLNVARSPVEPKDSRIVV